MIKGEVLEVIHKKTGKKIATEVRYAGTFLSRLRGLMFTPKLNGFDGLIIEPCNSIHNCFVYFSLDVVFMDQNNTAVKIIRNFKPWRFSWIYPKAKKVLELPSGKLPQEVIEGDELEVIGV